MATQPLLLELTQEKDSGDFFKGRMIMIANTLQQRKKKKKRGMQL